MYLYLSSLCTLLTGLNHDPVPCTRPVCGSRQRPFRSRNSGSWSSYPSAARNDPILHMYVAVCACVICVRAWASFSPSVLLRTACIPSYLPLTISVCVTHTSCLGTGPCSTPVGRAQLASRSILTLAIPSLQLPDPPPRCPA